MMRKTLFKKAAVWCAAAALVACGGGTAAAQTETAPAAAVVSAAEEAVTVTVSAAAGDSAYDIVTLDTASSAPLPSEKKSVNWGNIILVAFLVSAVGTGIAVGMVFRSYKYNGMTEPYEFKHKAPLELKEREDALVDVQVTSVQINRDRQS